MTEYLRRSWSVVNLDAIVHNVQTIRRSLQDGCRLMGVVKADAYGHGDKFVADALVQVGVDWFGVSNIEEALSLRTQGIYHPILIFGVTPPECANLLNEYHLTQTIYSLEYAQALHAAAQSAGVEINIHVKVDTGMSRIGFVMRGDISARSVSEIERICAMQRFHPEGIFTHFACADEAEDDSVAFTRQQHSLFLDCVDLLETRGVQFRIKHCCNSAGTMNYPEMHMDMVRPGIILYGLSPGAGCNSIDLQPAMELYSVVSMVKNIPAGTPVSYGRSYTAHRDMKVATVAIGYADGYERELSNRARMLVRGQYANTIGRVCMDQVMLDVTHIPGVTAGDAVTIVGTDRANTLTFDEMAQLSGTIAYEKICLIGRRVPRIYRRGGKDIGVVDYIRSQR